MNEIITKNTTETDFAEGKGNTPEAVENVAEREKPYKLRDLCAEDIFPMLTIVKKIGIKEFKECFNKEALEEIVGLFMNGAKTESKETESKDSENTLVVVGLSILPSALDLADVLLTNIPKCEVDFYKFLANISNLSVDKIKKLKMADFVEMIVDVIKKEDFKDFFKVVSKSFK
jgi:hypothetical protein